MVLIIAISVAAAAYASASSSDDDAQQKVDLEGKAVVNLLPLERTHALFEAPIAVITYMEGDSAAASEYLQKRVADVVAANPWLGGWLGKDPEDGALKLYYDETGEKLAPNLFRRFEIGEVGLTRDTPYENLQGVFETHDVKVKRNADAIGRDEALWRVSLIPDQELPEQRFALVISMSHMLGDGHTFFTVYNMLNRNNDIVALVPRRNLFFDRDVTKTMGSQEYYYVQKIAQSPLWSRFQRNETVISSRVFYVNEEWVEGQKLAWASLKAAKAAAKDSKSFSQAPMDPKAFAVSFASAPSALSLTTNDLITCWFFRLVEATVGFMPFNFRQRLTSYTNSQAGNYVGAIPYTPEDFETPMLIQQSRRTGRRSYADRPGNPTVLPSHSGENKYAFSVDWRSFQQRGGLALDDDIHQTLLLPLSDMRDIEALPKSFSFIKLFNAGPHGEPAVAVLAPQDVITKIERSGIVKEMLFGSEGPTEDLFLENIQETKRGRRTSVYAQFVEESS